MKYFYYVTIISYVCAVPTVGLNAVEYLADNICTWDQNTIVTPFYREVSATEGAIMQSETAAYLGWSAMKILTNIFHFFEKKKVDVDMSSAEVSMWFSDLDVFPDCRFMTFDERSCSTRHFKISMADNPPNVKFDGHVTDVRRYGGKGIFVNFKSKYVLFVSDKEISDVIDIAYSNKDIHSQSFSSAAAV